MMNRCITLLAFALLLCVSFTNAVTKEMAGSGAERRLEDPEKGMYTELVYMEKMCEDFTVQQINETAGFQIGDVISFNCELYEKAIRFGSHGGELKGATYWTCHVASFVDFFVSFQEFSAVIIWDCTITDYIGCPCEDGVDDDLGDGSYIRNQGIAIGIGPFGPDDQEGVLWERFHSHEGIFATTGGVIQAKGISGQMEVIWDMYKMTWFHIYHVEAWNLGPQPDYW
uniref:PPIase cyclophilin-type domain-containing protein n=1 Tax=Ditylum brightwellii TaxID=49249 RepID=A0A6V2EEE2_9STRA